MATAVSAGSELLAKLYQNNGDRVSGSAIYIGRSHDDLDVKLVLCADGDIIELDGQETNPIDNHNKWEVYAYTVAMTIVQLKAYIDDHKDEVQNVCITWGYIRIHYFGSGERMCVLVDLCTEYHMPILDNIKRTIRETTNCKTVDMEGPPSGFVGVHIID